MRKVAEEIIKTEISPSTIRTFRNKFFDIMRKNGIQQGEWHGNGRLTDNYEWTMCKNLFIDQIKGSLEMAFFFNTPEDLQAYGERDLKRLELINHEVNFKS